MTKLSQFIFPLFDTDEQRVKTRESLQGCCVRVIAPSPGIVQSIDDFKEWADTNLVAGWNHDHLFHMHMKDHPEVQGLIEIAVV